MTGYVHDRYDDAAVLERFPGPQDRCGAFRTFPPRRDNDESPELYSGESATTEAEPEASGAAAWFDIGSEDMRDILAAMPAAARPASYPEPESQFGSFGLLTMSPEDRRRILEEAGLVEDASRLNVEEQIELLGQRLADLIENERRSAVEIADIFVARPSRVSEYVHSRYQGNDEVLRRYPDPALPDSPDGVSSMTGIAQGIRFASARQAIDDRTRELLDELSAAERDNLLTQYLSHMIESEELTAERIAERLGVEPVRVVDYVHENYERDAAVRGRYPYPEEFRPPADPPSSPAAAAAPDSAVEAVAAAPPAARRGGDSGVRMGKATYELLRSGGMSDEEINALVSPRNYVNKAQAVVFLNAWRDRHGLPPVDDAGRAPAAPEPELAGEDDRVIDAGGDDAARDEAEADEEIADFDIDAPANPLLELGIRGDRRRRLVDDLLLFGSIDDPNVSDEVLNERLINYIRSEIIEGRELPVMARDLSVSPDLLLRFILRRRADLRLRESYIAPFVELDAQRQESAIDDAATTRAAGADDVPESGTPPPSADADGSREGGDFDDEESRVGELEADEPGPATDADDEYDALERRRQYAEELRQTLNSAVIGIAFRRGQIDREEATLALELARRGDLSLDPLAGPPAAADEAEGERIRDIVSRIEFRGTGQELRELQELFERIDSLDAGPGGADPDDDAGVPAPNASRRLYLELGYVARHFDRARRWLGFQTNAERDEAEQRHDAEQAEYEALVQQSREELRPDADIPRPEPLPSYGDFEDALERMTQEAGEASGALESARSRVSPVAGDLSPSLYAQALEDLDEEEQGQASRRIDEIRDRAVAELQLDGTPAQNRRELERWLRERNVAPRPGEVLPRGAPRPAAEPAAERAASDDEYVAPGDFARQVDRLMSRIEELEDRPVARKELIEEFVRERGLELKPPDDALTGSEASPAEAQDIAYYQLAGLPPEEAVERLTRQIRERAASEYDEDLLKRQIRDEHAELTSQIEYEDARRRPRLEDLPEYIEKTDLIWHVYAFGDVLSIEDWSRAEYDADPVEYVFQPVRQRIEDGEIVPALREGNLGYRDYRLVKLADVSRDLLRQLNDAADKGDADEVRDARARLLRDAVTRMDVADAVAPIDDVATEDVRTLRSKLHGTPPDLNPWQDVDDLSRSSDGTIRYALSQAVDDYNEALNEQSPAGAVARTAHDLRQRGVDVPDPDALSAATFRRELDGALERILSAAERPEERQELLDALVREYDLELSPEGEHAGELSLEERKRLAYYRLAEQPPDEVVQRLIDRARANGESALNDGSLEDYLTKSMTPPSGDIRGNNVLDLLEAQRLNQMHRLPGGGDVPGVFQLIEDPVYRNQLQRKETPWRRVPEDAVDRYGIGVYRSAFNDLVRQWGLEDHDVLASEDSAPGERIRSAIAGMRRQLAQEEFGDYLRTLPAEIRLARNLRFRFGHDPESGRIFEQEIPDGGRRQSSAVPRDLRELVDNVSQDDIDSVNRIKSKIERGHEAEIPADLEKYAQDPELRDTVHQYIRAQIANEVFDYMESTRGSDVTDEEKEKHIASIWRDREFNIYGPIAALYRAEGHDADLVGFMADAIKRNAEEKDILPVRMGDGYAPVNLTEYADELEARIDAAAAAEGDAEATQDARARILSDAASTLNVDDLVEPAEVSDAEIAEWREKRHGVPPGADRWNTTEELSRMPDDVIRYALTRAIDRSGLTNPDRAAFKRAESYLRQRGLDENLLHRQIGPERTVSVPAFGRPLQQQTANVVTTVDPYASGARMMLENRDPEWIREYVGGALEQSIRSGQNPAMIREVLQMSDEEISKSLNELLRRHGQESLIGARRRLGAQHEDRLDELEEEIRSLEGKPADIDAAVRAMRSAMSTTGLGEEQDLRQAYDALRRIQTEDEDEPLRDDIRWVRQRIRAAHQASVGLYDINRLRTAQARLRYRTEGESAELGAEEAFGAYREERTPLGLGDDSKEYAVDSVALALGMSPLQLHLAAVRHYHLTEPKWKGGTDEEWDEYQQRWRAHRNLYWRNLSISTRPAKGGDDEAREVRTADADNHIFNDLRADVVRSIISTRYQNWHEDLARQAADRVLLLQDMKDDALNRGWLVEFPETYLGSGGDDEGLVKLDNWRKSMDAAFREDTPQAYQRALTVRLNELKERYEEPHDDQHPVSVRDLFERNNQDYDGFIESVKQDPIVRIETRDQPSPDEKFIKSLMRSPTRKSHGKVPRLSQDQRARADAKQLTRDNFMVPAGRRNDPDAMPTGWAYRDARSYPDDTFDKEFLKAEARLNRQTGLALGAVGDRSEFDPEGTKTVAQYLADMRKKVHRLDHMEYVNDIWDAYDGQYIFKLPLQGQQPAGAPRLYQNVLNRLGVDAKSNRRVILRVYEDGSVLAMAQNMAAEGRPFTKGVALAMSRAENKETANRILALAGQEPSERAEAAPQETEDGRILEEPPGQGVSSWGRRLAVQYGRARNEDSKLQALSQIGRSTYGKVDIAYPPGGDDVDDFPPELRNRIYRSFGLVGVDDPYAIAVYLAGGTETKPSLVFTASPVDEDGKVGDVVAAGSQTLLGRPGGAVLRYMQNRLGLEESEDQSQAMRRSFAGRIQEMREQRARSEPGLRHLEPPAGIEEDAPYSVHFSGDFRDAAEDEDEQARVMDAVDLYTRRTYHYTHPKNDLDPKDGQRLPENLKRQIAGALGLAAGDRKQVGLHYLDDGSVMLAYWEPDQNPYRDAPERLMPSNMAGLEEALDPRARLRSAPSARDWVPPEMLGSPEDVAAPIPPRREEPDPDRERQPGRATVLMQAQIHYARNMPLEDIAARINRDNGLERTAEDIAAMLERYDDELGPDSEAAALRAERAAAGLEPGAAPEQPVDKATLWRQIARSRGADPDASALERDAGRHDLMDRLGIDADRYSWIDNALDRLDRLDDRTLSNIIKDRYHEKEARRLSPAAIGEKYQLSDEAMDMLFHHLDRKVLEAVTDADGNVIGAREQVAGPQSAARGRDALELGLYGEDAEEDADVNDASGAPDPDPLPDDMTRERNRRDLLDRPYTGARDALLAMLDATLEEAEQDENAGEYAADLSLIRQEFEEFRDRYRNWTPDPANRPASWDELREGLEGVYSRILDGQSESDEAESLSDRALARIDNLYADSAIVHNFIRDYAPPPPPAAAPPEAPPSEDAPAPPDAEVGGADAPEGAPPASGAATRRELRAMIRAQLELSFRQAAAAGVDAELLADYRERVAANLPEVVSYHDDGDWAAFLEAAAGLLEELDEDIGRRNPDKQDQGLNELSAGLTVIYEPVYDNWAEVGRPDDAVAPAPDVDADADAERTDDAVAAEPAEPPLPDDRSSGAAGDRVAADDAAAGDESERSDPARDRRSEDEKWLADALADAARERADAMSGRWVAEATPPREYGSPRAARERIVEQLERAFRQAADEGLPDDWLASHRRAVADLPAVSAGSDYEDDDWIRFSASVSALVTEIRMDGIDRGLAAGRDESGRDEEVAANEKLARDMQYLHATVKPLQDALENDPSAVYATARPAAEPPRADEGSAVVAGPDRERRPGAAEDDRWPDADAGAPDEIPVADAAAGDFPDLASLPPTAAREALLTELDEALAQAEANGVDRELLQYYRELTAELPTVVADDDEEGWERFALQAQETLLDIADNIGDELEQDPERPGLQSLHRRVDKLHEATILIDDEGFGGEPEPEPRPDRAAASRPSDPPAEGDNLLDSFLARYNEAEAEHRGRVDEADGAAGAASPADEAERIAAGAASPADEAERIAAEERALNAEIAGILDQPDATDDVPEAERERREKEAALRLVKGKLYAAARKELAESDLPASWYEKIAVNDKGVATVAAVRAAIKEYHDSLAETRVSPAVLDRISIGGGRQTETGGGGVPSDQLVTDELGVSEGDREKVLSIMRKLAEDDGDVDATADGFYRHKMELMLRKDKYDAVKMADKLDVLPDNLARYVTRNGGEFGLSAADLDEFLERLAEEAGLEPRELADLYRRGGSVGGAGAGLASDPGRGSDIGDNAYTRRAVRGYLEEKDRAEDADDDGGRGGGVPSDQLVTDELGVSEGDREKVLSIMRKLAEDDGDVDATADGFYRHKMELMLRKDKYDAVKMADKLDVLPDKLARYVTRNGGEFGLSAADLDRFLERLAEEAGLEPRELADLYRRGGSVGGAGAGLASDPGRGSDIGDNAYTRRAVRGYLEEKDRAEDADADDDDGVARDGGPDGGRNPSDEEVTDGLGVSRNDRERVLSIMRELAPRDARVDRYAVDDFYYRELRRLVRDNPDAVAIADSLDVAPDRLAAFVLQNNDRWFRLDERTLEGRFLERLGRTPGWTGRPWRPGSGAGGAGGSGGSGPARLADAGPERDIGDNRSSRQRIRAYLLSRSADDPERRGNWRCPSTRDALWTANVSATTRRVPKRVPPPISSRRRMWSALRNCTPATATWTKSPGSWTPAKRR